MSIGAQGVAVYQEEIKVVLTNRTGSTMAKGEVYAIDRLGTATESTTPETNAGNAVAVATANFHQDLVIADGAYLDDQTGSFTLVSDDVQVFVEGTTDVEEGTPLIPVNAQKYLIIQGAGSLVVACGMALEDQHSATPTLTRCAFDGRRMWKRAQPAS